MAQYYTSVDLSSALCVGPAIKDNKVYIAPLETPLTIQTPPLTLVGDVTHESTFAHLGVPTQFRAFLRSVETALLDAVLDNKDRVLGGRTVSDETLRANLKSFVTCETDETGETGETGTDTSDLKVRVSDSLDIFDSSKQAVGIEDARDGCRVRCVLELSRVCFGRAEWGGMWRLVQIQVCNQACLIDHEDPEDAEDAEDAEDSEDLADVVEEYM